MDEVTQQNASLVEEASSASKSLQEQAETLSGLVSTFILDKNQAHAGVSVRPVIRKKLQLQKMPDVIAANVSKVNWESF